MFSEQRMKKSYDINTYVYAVFYSLRKCYSLYMKRQITIARRIHIVVQKHREEYEKMKFI